MFALTIEMNVRKSFALVSSTSDVAGASPQVMFSREICSEESAMALVCIMPIHATRYGIPKGMKSLAKPSIFVGHQFDTFHRCLVVRSSSTLSPATSSTNFRNHF